MPTLSTDKHARDAVILGAARTPQGRFLGALAPLSAGELGAVAFRAAAERAGIATEAVHEVFVGNVVSAGVGQALPRQVILGAGLPPTVGGVAVNKVCGSGLRAVMMAAASIRADDGDLYLAGGTESMSRAPHLATGVRQGVKFGELTLRDSLQVDGLWCTFCDWGMGDAAEFIARELDVPRDAMDAFALRSHQRAAQATADGRFAAEMTPVEVPAKGGSVRVTTDEPIRADTSLDALAKLRPAFQADGRVTAGNAPGMNDGAAALVIASRAYAEQHGHTPRARVVGYAHAAVEPSWIFYAPVKAIPLALAKAGWAMDDVDLFEVNEAFAAQVLADQKGLARDGYTLPDDKLNVHGGAIALGHPLGASGARVLVTLLHALEAYDLRRGVAALCLGGGEAVALCLEREV